MTPRLDLGKVIAGAFLLPWWHRKAFARALAVPLALMVAFTVARRWAPRWSWRETRFFLWIVRLYAIALAAIWLFVLVVVNLWMWFIGDLGQWTEWMLYLVKIPAIYVFGRLCLLFPATAVDRAATLRWSWDLTRRNGWRLMIIVGGLPFVISCAIDLVYRNEATTVEWLILAVVAVALLAVQIAAVSLSYRELTRDEPQLSTTATT